MVSNKLLVLLTGASSGLGLVLAKMLIAEQKYRLVLTARKSSLSRFAKHGINQSCDILLRPLDVANQEERAAVINECEEKLGGLDILINNAGVAMRSVVEDASSDDRIGLLAINYIGPMRLIALALPGMRRRGRGKIINISSAAGIVGMPTMACYCGSKFALEGVTESLWYEVKPWGISVSLIIPGFTCSDSFLNTKTTMRSRLALESDGKDPYYLHYANMEKHIQWTMRRTFATPESVSRKIMSVMDKKNPSLRVPATLDAWFLFLFRRFVPRAIYHWMMRQALPKYGIWGKSPSYRCIEKTPKISASSRNW